MTALVVAPLTAVASHVFNDVPESHTFHNDITWMEQSGVTRGCNPPDNTEYCPDDNVTRGQMAAFMNRFAGYIGATDGTPAQADNARNADHATTSDNADNADTLAGNGASDFLQSGTLTTTIGGAGWMPHLDAPTDIDRLVSGTSFSGDGAAVLSLQTPTDIEGVTFGLATFELCYDLAGGGQLDRVSVWRTNQGSTDSSLLFVDTTNRTSTDCTIYPVYRAVGNGASIYVSFAGGGTVRLGGVEATWSGSADIAGTETPTEEANEDG